MISRRQFLSAAAPALFRKRRPNFVVFLTDDHGPWAWQDECQEFRTPHLTRLARSGMTFTRAYSATPVCSPSRMTLFTGLLPCQHGVQDYLLPEESFGLGARRYLDGRFTWSQRLQEAGYVLGMSGKWHMGDDPAPQAGFSFWVTVPGGGGTYRDAPFWKNGQRTHAPGFKTDVQGDFALEFLESRASRPEPFCLYLPFYAPHTPYDFQPERDRMPYAESTFGCFPRLPRHPRQNLSLRNHHLREESMRSYSALVTGIDENVGRILHQIERMGAWEDTIVVFTADQGWNAGHHGVWGKGNGTVPFNLYEESVRVPMIWHAPGRIPPGRRCEALISHYDFLPTLLDLAGEASAVPRGLPGRSYRAWLEGRRPRWREDLYFEYAYVRGIRTSREKLILREPGLPGEYYDLAADPGETQNLFADPALQARQARLERPLRSFFFSLGAPPLAEWRRTTTQKLFDYPEPQ